MKATAALRIPAARLAGGGWTVPGKGPRPQWQRRGIVQHDEERAWAARDSGLEVEVTSAKKHPV